MMHNGTTRLALVTVLYHSESVLPDFFESLGMQGNDLHFKLFIVDNSESMNSEGICRNYIKKFAIDAEYIFNGENLGVAEGNNIGIKKALEQKFDKILLLNNDITFGKDTLSTLLDYSFRFNERIFVPKIYFHGSDILWMAGASLSKWTTLTPHRGEGERDIGQYDLSDVVNYAPTCFMLIDSAVFDTVGLMDEKYFVYYDDTDFIYRCGQAGFNIRYLPDISITHKVSALTGGNQSLFSVFYANRNRLYFIMKNMKGLYKISSLGYFFSTRILSSFRNSFLVNKVIFKAILSSGTMRRM